MIPIAFAIIYFFTEEPIEKNVVIVNLIIWPLLILILKAIRIKNDVSIVGGEQTITLYREIPSKPEVDNFVKIIIEKTRKTIRDKYFRIDLDIDEELQMNTFNWLLNNEYISKNEYEEVKLEYKNKRLIE